MCGRFVITSPPAALRQIFGYVEQPNFPPRHNIAPTQPVPVVIVENGGRHFRLMRWGLLPSWVKDPRTFTLLINARRRDGQGKAGLQERDQAAALPDSGRRLLRMAGIVDAASGPISSIAAMAQPMGLAGLAETWMGPNGEELDTVAIVTAAASADLAVLHHRVPVTIGPRRFRALARLQRRRCGERDGADGTAARAANSPGMRFPRRVNRVANDDAQLVLPITAEQREAEEPKPRGRRVARKSAPVAAR